MLTLGNKEAVINTTAQCVLTPAAATPGAVLNIKGFGTFDPTKLLGYQARRYSAAQLEKIQITIPTATELGIATTAVNVPVVFRLKMYTLRHASETAIDFIKKGRPLVLEILVQGNTDGTAINTLLQTAITEYQAKFANVVFPFTVDSVLTTAATLVLTATEGFYTFGEDVELHVSRIIFPYTPTVTKKFIMNVHVNAVPGGTDNHVHLDSIVGLAVGDTISFDALVTASFKITDIVTSTGIVYITPSLTGAGEAANTNHVWKVWKGVEAIGDGKSMEESVRMSNIWTSDTYAINPNVVPIIGAEYTMIQWTMSANATEGGWMGHDVAGAVAADITPQVFTLYVNDTITEVAAGVIDLLLVWLDAAAVSYVSGYTQFSSLKKANGASAVSIDNFIA
jgi:hypothetical protein